MQLNLTHSRRGILLLIMTLCLYFEANAQTTISGKVVGGDDNLPIIGATIKKKVGPGGSTTDANGSFTISATPTDILVVSFVGYTTQEVSVANNKSLTITLQPSQNSLTEVVVTGYTTSERRI